MSIRERLEAAEQAALSSHAQLSSQSKGRVRPEAEDEMRTAFQRDRDRILHCRSFRRLAGKTQVFLAPEGDHYRTRITHSLEVSQVARTITRCLALNEQLTEVIAMGHDLGHTPFGHAGEHTLAHLMPGGFHHAKQSLRVVDQLEREGTGLNLTQEVRDGILKHSKGKGPILSDNPNLTAMTLEGQIVRLADIVAYVNHDLDDAVRGGLLTEKEIPAAIRAVLGEHHSDRIRTLVLAVVNGTNLDEKRRIGMHGEVLGALDALREFLYQRVYDEPKVHDEFEKAQAILGDLWAWYHAHPDEFREKWWPKGTRADEGLDRAVCDFISGMTDRYALRAFEELRLPRRWHIY
jgi:dGTPase